jgi:hypothetical protein
MTKQSPDVAIFNRGAISPDSCISAYRARFLVAGLRTNRTSHPSGSSITTYCAVSPGSLLAAPEKTLVPFRVPNMSYRSVVTELAGPTLAWLAIQAIAYSVVLDLYLTACRSFMVGADD